MSKLILLSSHEWKNSDRIDFIKQYGVEGDDGDIYDFFKCLLKNPDIHISSVYFEAEHDAGCGSDKDYKHYPTLESFLESDDYRYGPGEGEYYDCYGSYKGNSIVLGIGKCLVLRCLNSELDLIKILEE